MCIYLLVFVYLLRLGLKDKYLRRIAIVWFKYASPCNSSGWQNSRWDIWSNLATIISLFDNHLRKELMPNILNLMRGISVFFCMYFHLFLSFFVCDLVVPCVCVCSVSFFLCLWSVCAMCVCVMLLPLFACDLFVPCVCVCVCLCVCPASLSRSRVSINIKNKS